MQKFLLIELEKSHSVTLRFRLLNTPLTALWLERMQRRDAWVMDDPERFYGFNSPEEELARAEKMITDCIKDINQYRPIIDRSFTTVFDQDCLNYLHHIFEEYHGLLDQQQHDFWRQAPDTVRQALANLNIAVHRCESIAKRNPPRFVCTWFGMPKTKILSKDIMMRYGTTKIQFGGVYLNYVEIGKTFEDLVNDDDDYINDDAFQPFHHYSADFFVSFFDKDCQAQQTDMEKYFVQHRDFFHRRGIESLNDVRLRPLRFPIAILDSHETPAQLFESIKNNQYIKNITIL